VIAINGRLACRGWGFLEPLGVRASSAVVGPYEGWAC
jgi:hypothetical protein